MRLRNHIWLAVSLGLMTAAGRAGAEEPIELAWKALAPSGDVERLASTQVMALLRAAPHGSVDDMPVSMQAIQPGFYGTVSALDGKSVRISGYVVPLEFEGGASRQFLLVPYYGACIHAPPPPPNQTILVQSDQPVVLGSLSFAKEVEGTLHVSQNASAMADSAYLLDLSSLKKRS